MSGNAMAWAARERQLALHAAPRAPSIAQVILASARAYGVPVVHVLSERRTVRVAGARQVAMHLALDLSGHGSTTIGLTMKRDPSTVLHGDRVVRDRMARDAAFAARLAALRQTLTQSPEGDA